MELREFMIELLNRNGRRDEVNAFLSRLVIITGLRTTGDNIDFLLHWIDSLIPSKSTTSIIAIEEGFLGNDNYAMKHTA